MKRPHFFTVMLLLITAVLATAGLPADANDAPSVSAGLTFVQMESQDSAIQTNVPVTFGQVFKRGDIPAGSSLVAQSPNGTDLPLQVDAKATHADGSLRHAILTTIQPTLPDGDTQTINLIASSEPLTGDPVQLADLLGTSFDVAVALNMGGTLYTASARDLLQAATPQTWLAGPLVTEWMVSAPFKNAADQPHPHLTARFQVRAYAGMGQVHVDVIVENNWAYEPDPQNLTYDVTITIDSNQVYAKSALMHYSQSRWRKSFWWGDAPQIHLRHDAAYLISTGAVPNYDTSLVIPNAVLADLENEWALDDTKPMDIGLPIAYMPTGGGRRDIGPLPSWTAHYLLSMDARAKIPALGTADLAGSWPIHFRDKDTDLPVSLADYPYMTLLGNYGDTLNPDTGEYEAFPNCGDDCSTPYSPDASHQPSLAYLPYLVTGDLYYLEELHFWANWNLFRSNPYYREFEQGLFKSGQVRGQAWAMRTLGNAAYITPDAHPLKSYFVDRVGTNLNWYRQEYPDNPSANQLGVLTNGYALAYNSGRGVAPWQDDFFTWSVGNLVDQGFSAAVPLLQWKAKFPEGRMIAPGTCWIFGAIYSLNIRDGENDPFYTTMAEAYDASVEPGARDLACAGQAMADYLGLQVGEMTGYSYSPEGYPSNMQPALAMAAQSGIPGGFEAWNVFMNRAVKPDYSDEPNFAIVPRFMNPFPGQVYLPVIWVKPTASAG